MGVVAQKAAEELGSRVTAIAKRFWHEADAMHALLVKHADAFVGCTEGSSEEDGRREGVSGTTRRAMRHVKSGCRVRSPA
jgi:hypothetical protein